MNEFDLMGNIFLWITELDYYALHCVMQFNKNKLDRFNSQATNVISHQIGMACINYVKLVLFPLSQWL